MVTSNREEFLRYARAHRRLSPLRPIKVTRDVGWQPSLFTYDDGSKPTVLTMTPQVFISYVTWSDGEPVMLREVFGGVIAVDVNAGVASVEVVFEDSLHDWLIANANEVELGHEGEYVRVYADEPARELQYAIDYATSLTQKV